LLGLLAFFLAINPLQKGFTVTINTLLDAINADDIGPDT